MILSSSDKTIIIDDEFTLFELSSFNFEIKNEFLKGTDIAVIHNSQVPLGESDKLYFKNGFFDLKNSRNLNFIFTFWTFCCSAFCFSPNYRTYKRAGSNSRCKHY